MAERIPEWAREAASDIDALFVTNMAAGSLTPVQSIAAIIAQHAPPDVTDELKRLAQAETLEVLVFPSGKIELFVEGFDIKSDTLPAAVAEARRAMGDA